MNMIDRLMAQLSNRGIGVAYVSETELKLTGNVKAADEKLIAAVKAFKPDLMERVRPRDLTLKRHDVHHAPPPPEAVPASEDVKTCETCNSWVHPENGREDIARLCHESRCPFKGKGRHG